MSKWKAKTDSKGSVIDRFIHHNHFSFHTVYTGNLSSHKINKLQENTTYRFRICAKNDAGVGPWSDVYAFTTAKAPPNPLKGKTRIDFVFLFPI